MSDTPDAVFEPLGDERYLPTTAARGPWDPRALHGGAPSALLAGALERALAGPDQEGVDPLRPTRLTIDLERPVGLVPMTVRTWIARAGRKVRIAEAELLDDAGTRLARATLLGIRRLRGELDLTEAVPGASVAPPARPEAPMPADDPHFARMVEGPMFHSDAVEHRFVAGALGEPGPGIDWIRLRLEVVAGQPVTPLQRVAAAADFGNGIGAAFPRGWSFINPDLTVTLHGLPVGEWVCLDASTFLGTDGTGVAEAVLWDERGRIGRSLQTLLVEPPV